MYTDHRSTLYSSSAHLAPLDPFPLSARANPWLDWETFAFPLVLGKGYIRYTYEDDTKWEKERKGKDRKG
jgi:hypothetical protein